MSKKQPGINLILPVTVTIACLIAAAVIGSRSFFIGYTCALALCFLIIKRFRVNKSMLWSIALVPTMLTIALMLLIKSDSSQGRLLIYKISFNILHDHFITGTGLGNFGAYYSNYQAAYFKAGHFTTKELLLADNVDCLYNDYLQFIIETGIAGSLLLFGALALVIRLFVITICKYLATPFPALLLIAITQATAIGIAALFRFVFINPFFLCLMLAALAIIYSYYQFTKTPWLKSIPLSIVMILTVIWFHYGKYISKHNYYNQYREARMLGSAGYWQESLLIYKQLYKALKEDKAFSRDYISALTQCGECAHAIDEMKRVLTRAGNYMIYIRLADCYYETGRYTEAERAYKQSVYIVPNRFSTRYKLFTFYQRTGQHAKALTTGKDLLAIPVKIPSLHVTHIKNAVEQYVKVQGRENHSTTN